MKRLLLYFAPALLIAVAVPACAYAQSVAIEQFPSKALGASRQIRISLPASYAAAPTKRYPLILAFDGEYLFYDVLGASNMLSIYEVAPEAIVVAIDQNAPGADGRGLRWSDCSFNEQTASLKPSGQAFKAFVLEELVPAIDRRYRTSPFRTLVGHSFTATCLHFFLLDPKPAFAAYVAISPYMPNSLFAPVGNALSRTGKPLFYFASTGTNDLSGHIGPLVELNRTRLSKIANRDLFYRFRNYPEATHMSVVNRSIEEALDMVFSLAGQPRGESWRDPAFLADPPAYLDARHARAAETYGVSKEPVSEQEVSAAAQMLIEGKAWAGLKQLGLHARNTFPSTSLGDFALAQYYQNIGHFRQAIEVQRTSCTKFPEGAPGHKYCVSLVAKLEAMWAQ